MLRLPRGTVAKFVPEAARVAFCVVTNGDKGSGDRTMTPERLATIWQEAQRNAARVLGVEVVEFLDFSDCEVENTREASMAVIAAIRRHRPDLILTQNPERTKRLGVSHRDHRIVGGIGLDCVYPLARDHMTFPELLAQGLEPHTVTEGAGLAVCGDVYPGDVVLSPWIQPSRFSRYRGCFTLSEESVRPCAR